MTPRRVRLTPAAVAAGRDGDDGRLVAELVADGTDPATADALARDLSATVPVARFLASGPDGWREVAVAAGPAAALVVDADGAPDRATPVGIARHLDAVVHLLLSAVGFGWRPTPAPGDLDLDDPAAAGAAARDWASSTLAPRLSPTVDPAEVRWWAWTPASSVPGPAGPVAVLDAGAGGLRRQHGTRLVPTTATAVWGDLRARVAAATPAVAPDDEVTTGH